MSTDSISIGWTRDDVHPTLREDLDLNPQVFDYYVRQVTKAVQTSLNHPDTKPRVLTASLMKERVNLAHRLIMVMREDHLFPLRKVLDLLPDRLLEALRRDAKEEDVVSEVPNRSMWKKDSPSVLRTVDLNEVEDIEDGPLGEGMEDAIKEVGYEPPEDDD
jgi:hypothetical protein